MRSQGVCCLLVILAACVFLPSRSPAQAPVLPGIDFELIAPGLDLPVAITNAGDNSGRLFLTLQRGQIVIHNGAQLLDTPFLDIGSRVTCCGERGLLSTAFHPDFAANGFFFVNYTNTGGDSVVSRFRVSGNPNIADASSEMILLTVQQPFSNHNGGQLQFGPDGYLYIGLGDGGSAGDPGDRAQSLNTLLGKILRIDVDQGSPYSVPANNPFVGTPGARPEIWAFGLRNPWRFSFDRETGDMFIGDVGQNSVEEVNFQQGSSNGGENYGWRRMEGSQCFNPSSGCMAASLTGPILEYSHTGSGCGGSVSGGYRYRGAGAPQLRGIYFYADYCSGRLYAASANNGVWTAEGPRQTSFSISSFGEDEAGEIYFTHHTGGAIYRITADRPVPAISSVSPGSTVAGGPVFSLTVSGSNFVPSAEVRWNGDSRPTTFLTNGQLQATISAADTLAAGVNEVRVLNPPPGGGLSQPVFFQVIPMPVMPPAIDQGGIVEAAGFNPAQGLSPGAIAAVFGTDLASSIEPSNSLPLPATLGGATLLFNNAIPAPLYYADPTQLNIQIPWELEGFGQALLTPLVGGMQGAAVMVSLTAFSPGLFSMNGMGGGQGAIQIAGTEGAIAAPLGAFLEPVPSRPAKPGEFLAIYATGLGPVTNTPPTGMITPLAPLAETLTAPSVTIGGIEQQVAFHGLAPGAVALYQVNVEVAVETPPGDAVPVILQLGGKTSNTVTVAVAP